MPNTQVELALGKIKIELIDSSTTNPVVYFGLINSLGIKDSEQLKVFYAPDNSSPTLRSRFGALSLSGAGQITLGGVIASTRGDSEYDFCSGLDELVSASLERKIWEQINLNLDFTFDDTADKTYNLYDGRVSSPQLQGQGNMMSGRFTLQYSWAEPD